MKVVYANYSPIRCFGEYGCYYFEDYLILGTHTHEELPVEIEIENNELILKEKNEKAKSSYGFFSVILKNAEHVAVSSWEIELTDTTINLKLLAGPKFFKDLQRQNFVYDFWSKRGGYRPNLSMGEALEILNHSYQNYRMTCLRIEKMRNWAIHFKENHPWFSKIPAVRRLLDNLIQASLE